MSDSEGEIRPPDAVIEKALRSIVAGFYKTNDLEAVTLRRVRADASTKLRIAEDFFKTDEKWKSKSKEIITDEVEKQDNPSHVTAPSPASKPKASAPASAQKRKSVNTASKPPTKKQRKESTPPDDSSTEGDPGSADKRDAAVSDSDLSSVTDDAPAPNKKQAAATKQTKPAKPAKAETADSDSDLSSLIDDSPPSKKKKQQSQAPASKQSKPDSKVSPQEEEIKRLQSQLVKCGVRKLWGKELKPFDTPREKISHLKELLADAGMTGRFSEERARQIKEARELAADLETIQERNKAWGQSDDEEDAVGRQGRRKRAAAQNLAELDQFDDSDDDSD